MNNENQVTQPKWVTTEDGCGIPIIHFETQSIEELAEYIAGLSIDALQFTSKSAIITV